MKHQNSFRFKFMIRKEKYFLSLILISLLAAGIIYPYPHAARWFGFGLAAYSAIANDSIQTIGTFIASNYQRKWWWLWLYIGVLFVIVVTISWFLWDGDVSFQRLQTKGFDVTPASFAFLQIAAPIVLLILTRMKMPVSTTFLLLSSFTTSTTAIFGVLEKSLFGYIIAFATSFLIWRILSGFIKKILKGKAHKTWDVAQWITSGTLWSFWIIQDAANIAVYLPRQLNLLEFLVFTGVIFFGLGLIFFLKGDKIQDVVNEKTAVKDVRSATLIDLVYTLILILFTWISTVPMSTTWIFIGLLGGRELAIYSSQKYGYKNQMVWKMIRKDVRNAFIGLIISIIIAVSVNPNLQMELKSYLEFIKSII